MHEEVEPGEGHEDGEGGYRQPDAPSPGTERHGDGDSARACHGGMSRGERPIAGRVDNEHHAGIDHERARTHENALEESDDDLGQRDRDNGGGACLTRRFSRQQRRRYHKPDERI